MTHVMLPIDEYEKLLETGMVQEALAHRDDPPERFVDAWELGLRLAGERLAAARKVAGLTQKQLGRKLGVPQSQISRIERNPDRTTVRTLKRLAKALGVDVASLVG